MLKTFEAGDFPVETKFERLILEKRSEKRPNLVRQTNVSELNKNGEGQGLYAKLRLLR